MIMADVMPENKSRNHILDLETDIQKSMKSGFPHLFFTSQLEQHFLADTLNARKNRFFIHGSHRYLYLQSLPHHGQRNAPRCLSDGLEDPVGDCHPCHGNMSVHHAQALTRPIY